MNTTTIEDRIKARIAEINVDLAAEYSRLHAERDAKVAALDADITLRLHPYHVAIGELTALIDGQVAG